MLEWTPTVENPRVAYFYLLTIRGKHLCQSRHTCDMIQRRCRTPAFQQYRPKIRSAVFQRSCCIRSYWIGLLRWHSANPREIITPIRELHDDPPSVHLGRYQTCYWLCLTGRCESTSSSRAQSTFKPCGVPNLAYRSLESPSDMGYSNLPRNGFSIMLRPLVP